jgi:ribosomal protein S18 acetylase RimI-like enzyme
MPEPAVDIRPFRSGDGDGLRALWTDAGFRLIGDDDPGLERFAERNPGLFLVAVDERGVIVGTAMGAWDGRRGWLYHVATDVSRRRTGLAAELVRRVEDALRGLGCRRALVIVERGNESGIAFWRAQGYEPRETVHLGKRL